MTTPAPVADLRDRTGWDALRRIFGGVQNDFTFFPSTWRDLQRLLLMLLDPDADPDSPLSRIEGIREHVWTGFEMDCVRWAKMCEVLDRDESWDAAGEIASNELQATPVSGGASAMESAYKDINKILPPGLQRPRRPRGPNRH